MLHARLRAAAGRDRIPTDGLIAWYTMDNISGSTLVDEMGNYDGTISGATQASGLIGQALSFNGGDQYVSISSAVIPGLSEISISAFINPGNTSPSSNIHVFRQRGGVGNELCHARIESTGYTIQAKGTIGGVVYDLKTPLSVSSYLNAQGWAHLLINYDGSSVFLYVNNSLQDSVSASGVFSASSDPLFLSRNGSFGQNWSGLIDQLRIYNRSCSESERNSLYSEGL